MSFGRGKEQAAAFAAFPDGGVSDCGSDAARAVFAEYLGGENGEIFDAVRQREGLAYTASFDRISGLRRLRRALLRSDFAAKRRWRPQNIFANIRTACARRDRFRKILRRAGLRARAHGGEVLRPRRNRALCRGVSLFAREARGAFSAGGGGWGNRNFRRAPVCGPRFFKSVFLFGVEMNTPVFEIEKSLYAAADAGKRRFVVSAPTGSGKSTGLPSCCCGNSAEGFSCSSRRRVAARMARPLRRRALRYARRCRVARAL